MIKLIVPLNHLLCLFLLAGCGAMLIMKTSFGPFDKAVRGNQYGDLNRLLEDGADINAQNNHGVTALMKACQHGRLEVVRFLRASQSNSSLKDKNGRTALFYAVQHDKKRIVRFLIDND